MKGQGDNLALLVEFQPRVFSHLSAGGQLEQPWEVKSSTKAGASLFCAVAAAVKAAKKTAKISLFMVSPRCQSKLYTGEGNGKFQESPEYVLGSNVRYVIFFPFFNHTSHRGQPRPVTRLSAEHVVISLTWFFQDQSVSIVLLSGNFMGRSRASWKLLLNHEKLD